MDQWKRNFLSKLSQAQSQWSSRFEDALDTHFVPVFDEYKQFLTDNGFRLSTPLNEPGRRSFKFELAENAYLLMIFRSTGVGEFELRCESFVPGSEPALARTTARADELNEEWVTRHTQAALDTFVDSLAGSDTSKKAPEPTAEDVDSVAAAASTLL
jgi:hypothetical protein